MINLIKFTAAIVYFLIFGCSYLIKAQDYQTAADTIAQEIRPVPFHECPQVIREALSTDSLKSKAALAIINLSNHPLGKYELYDNKKRYKALDVNIVMNRITLLYVSEGVYRFHSMYQKLFDDVMYKAGDIYLVVLISTNKWPIPYIFIKEDKAGRENVPVLFYYINAAEAKELESKIKNFEVVVNGAGKRK